MTKRTEKELRADLADKKLAPEQIDILVKAEREAGRLKDDLEDEADEAAVWDAHGESLAKAKAEADAELAKAAEIDVDVYDVGAAPGGPATSPEQRESGSRRKIQEEIETIDPDEALRDIVKAFDEASAPRFQALSKALGEGMRQLVKRIEGRLSAQDKLLGAVLEQNTLLTKAARKSATKIADLQKALDTTPAGRVPRYTLNDVEALPRPGDPPARGGSQVNIDDLSDFIGNELAKATEGESGLAERQRVETLYSAMSDLDSGVRTPEQIARAIGFKTA